MWLSRRLRGPGKKTVTIKYRGQDITGNVFDTFGTTMNLSLRLTKFTSCKIFRSTRWSDRRYPRTSLDTFVSSRSAKDAAPTIRNHNNLLRNKFAGEFFFSAFAHFGEKIELLMTVFWLYRSLRNRSSSLQNRSKIQSCPALSIDRGQNMVDRHFRFNLSKMGGRAKKHLLLH